jgi:hypothetical protein
MPTISAVAFVAPGPLIAAHAALTCFDCHAGPAPDVAGQRCLGCHVHAGLRERIYAGRGFHASKGVRNRPCETCHSDHKGARFDAFGWKSITGGQTGFDHRLTGWPLAGPHARASCASCHTQKTQGGRPTFLAADRQCGACHKNQPHGFERREMLACSRCHTTAAWAPAKRVLEFDHDDRKDAAMPIRGQHRKLACVACHPGGQFNSPLEQPAACQSCHPTPHAGRIWEKRACGDCHDVFTFKTADALFDHAERTKFTLGASHRQLACATCHTKALGTVAPSGACESCHAKRSPHQDRFNAFGTPPACAVCHAPSMEFNPTVKGPPPAWKPNRFDHGKNTKWRLTGKHATLACSACHRPSSPPKFERLKSGTACMACHAKVHADDAHPSGKFTDAQCVQCHPR